MKQVWQIFLLVLVFFLGLFLIYKKGEKSGIDSEVLKQQSQQIVTQKNVIETKNFQQKIIAKAPDSDIARDKWLRLVWKLRTEAEK